MSTLRFSTYSAVETGFSWGVEIMNRLVWDVLHLHRLKYIYMYSNSSLAGQFVAISPNLRNPFFTVGLLLSVKHFLPYVRFLIEVLIRKWIPFQAGIPSKGASSVLLERTSLAHALRVLKVCRPVLIWQTAVWTWFLSNTRHGCSTSDTWSGSRLKVIRWDTKISLKLRIRFDYLWRISDCFISERDVMQPVNRNLLTHECRKTKNKIMTLANNKWTQTIQSTNQKTWTKPMKPAQRACRGWF